MTIALERTPLTTTLSSSSSRDPVWVRVGKLLDGRSARPLEQAHLVYDADQVRYVGAEPPPADRVAGQAAPVNLPGYTVLPGLIDAHTHLFLDGAPVNLEERKQYLTESPDYWLKRALDRLPRLVRMGILAVRDAGDRAGVGLALRDAYRNASAGPAAAPYIDSPGAAIHHRERYGSFMARAVEEYSSPAECVASRVEEGADRIKLLATGIIDFKQGRVVAPPQMNTEELREFALAAAAHGRPTFAHASGAEGIGSVIDAGIASVEHAFFVTDEQLARMRDRQTIWVPTFAPVQAQVDFADEMGWDETVVRNLRLILEGHARSLQRAHSIGVPIAAGSDAGSCGVPHGLGLLRELELMQQAGLSPLQVLNAATGYCSRLLAWTEPIGRLAQGCRSRMIFTEAGVLSDVSNLRSDRTIVFDGVVVQAETQFGAKGL